MTLFFWSFHSNETEKSWWGKLSEPHVVFQLLFIWKCAIFFTCSQRNMMDVQVSMKKSRGKKKLYWSGAQTGFFSWTFYYRWQTMRNALCASRTFLQKGAHTTLLKRWENVHPQRVSERQMDLKLCVVVYLGVIKKAKYMSKLPKTISGVS